MICRVSVDRVAALRRCFWVMVGCFGRLTDSKESPCFHGSQEVAGICSNKQAMEVGNRR